MGRLKALAIASMIALGGTGSALAADLLPPPPPVDAPLRGAIFDNSGFYVRGDAGVAIDTFAQASSTIYNAGVLVNPADNALTYDGKRVTIGGIFGLGFGYQFNNWFRADLTGEWHGGGSWSSRESYEYVNANSLCANNGIRCSDLYSANINHGVILANGYVDLGTWGGLTPYLGIGLGTAYNHIGSISDTNGTALLAANDVHYSSAVSKWNFAWALMAGVSFDITQNLKMDVSYRYLNMGSMDGGTVVCTTPGGCGLTEIQHFKFASNDIRIGLRYMFGGEVPPPPPPVLVRKY